MAEGTVDNLNIQLSADADQAVKSLNNLASTLRSINTAFTKDISGMRKFSKEIGTMTAALKGLNNIKVSAPDLSKISKSMKELSEIKTSGAKNAAGDVKDIIESLRGLGSVNFNESGITKLTNSLRRLTQVDLSTFDTSKFSQITNAVATLGNMPDVSSGVNRFVSSLSRLANAGEKTGQSANSIQKLGEETKEAAIKLQSVGTINDDVNLFVQSIGRLASAGNKTSQTASGLSTLADETLKFFQAMQNAPKVSENTIRMTQALAQLATAGGKVGTSTNTVTSAFNKLASVGNKTLSAMKKVANGIVSAFQRIGNSSGGLTKAQFSLSNLLKTAVGFRLGYGLLNFGKQAFQLGSDITEVENVVDVAFGGMAQSSYDFAKTAQEQFGLSELMALRYSGTMMSVLNASGVAQRDAAEMSTTLTGLAGDLASFYNISQDNAWEKIMSGMAGEIEPLRRLGINMSVANLEAYALSQGITKSWQSMTQAEQVMLRYNYLMQASAQQQGDFARTSWSWANQIRLLTLNIQQLAATIGQGLIAAVLPAVTALNKLFAVLQKAATAVRNFFYVLTGYEGGGSSGIVNDFASAADSVEDLGTSGSDAAGGLEDAAKAAEDLKNATLGIDELNIISPNDVSVGGTGGSGGGGGGTGGVGGSDLGLDDGLLDLGEKDPEKYVSPWAQRIRDAFLAEDWELLGEEIAWGLNKGLQKVYDVISWENVGPKITAFTTAFTRSFNSLVDNFDWDLLGRTIGTGINTVVNTLNQFITGINWRNLGNKLAEGIMGIVNEVNWTNLGQLLGNKFMISWDILYGFVERLDFSQIGRSLANGFNGMIESIDLSVVGAGIGKTISGIVNMFREFAENADWWKVGKEIGKGISSLFDNFNFGDLANALNVWADGLLKAITGAISKIKWYKAFDAITDFVGNLDLGGAFLIAIPATKKLYKALGNLSKNFNKVKKYALLAKDSFIGNQNAVSELTKRFPTLGKAIDAVGTAFQQVMFGAHYGDLKGGINTAITTIKNNLTGLQKGVVGTVAVFGEFSYVKDAIYDIVTSSDNLVSSIGKIAVSAGAAATAMYVAFGPAGVAVAGITALIAAIFGANSAMEEQKQIASEQEELKLYGDTVDNITASINESSNAIKSRAQAAQEYVETAGLAETNMAKDLANRYFNLAEKENLTNSEKEEMKRLAEVLVNTLPDLETYYNTQTGLLDTTREKIDEVIDSRLQEIKLSAVEDKLKEAYEDRITALDELQDTMQIANDKQAEMNRLNEAYEDAIEKTKAFTRYNEISQELQNATGDTSELIAEQNKLVDFLTEGSTKPFPTFTSLGEDVANARSDIAEFESDYNKAFETLSNADEAYEAVGSNIETLTEMLTTGMVNAAGDSAEGYANALSDDESMATSVTNKVDELLKAFADRQESGSPSQKFADLAQDSIDGYVLGIEKNTEIAKKAMKKLVDQIVKEFDSSLSSKLEAQAAQTGNMISTSLGNAWKNVKSTYSDVASFFKNQFNQAYRSVTSIWSPVNTWFSSKWVAVKNVFKTVPQTFKTWFNSAYTNVKTIWNPVNTWFASKWNLIKNVFSPSVVNSFKNWFQTAYKNVQSTWNPVNTWFASKWIAVKSVFKDVNSYFSSGFRTAYNSVTNIWSGLGNFFKKVAQNAFNPIKKLVNGIISGVNWVLKEVDSGTRVSSWGGVAFAKGSDGVPRNMMGVVNDQKGATYKELIVPPNGKPFIPKGRNVMLPLQKGTKIMPANQTKEFLKGFSKLPHFAEGIGSLFGWNEKFSGDMFDYLDKPDAVTKIALDKYVDVSGLAELWRDMAKGIVGTAFDSISEFIGTIFEKIVPKVDYNPSEGVEQWRQLAKYALQLEGQYTEANLDRLLMQMQTESGGNPNAINNWDINAQRGTPSKGLMQVIDPTFRSYARPGYSSNIYDPLSNILASIRYTVSRYGSLANGWKGHGYASGIGTITMADLFSAIPKLAGGGVVMPGQLFVANERGPELLGRYRNRTTVVNNDQVVSSVSSGVEKAVQRQNTEMTLLLRQILETNQQILAKDISVNLDGKRTNRLLDRAKSNAGYGFRRTVTAT